jgi:hypothetical protein
VRKNGQLHYVPDALVMPKKRKSSPSKKYNTILMECGHTITFKANTPGRDEYLWCFSCEEYSRRK